MWKNRRRSVGVTCSCGCGTSRRSDGPDGSFSQPALQNLVRLVAKMGRIASVNITGNTKQKELKLIYEKIESGEISIVVGTTSLINENVKFKSLGLAVVDEQHRFGVNQRLETPLERRRPRAHVDYVRDTIPRTLAMTKFGEMALSVIEEKPAGRLPIWTKVLDPPEHEVAFEAIQEETQRGGQAYVILRYVSDKDTEKNQTKGAEEEFERLKLKLPNVKFGLLHGQLSSEEKQTALDLFAVGETQCLVATSVVEVGVDVPNASLIVIDASGGGGSGGFGLAALHQLRGRVGRGSRQSRCFLLNTHRTKTAKKRARLVLEKTNDGFRVAESDLQLQEPAIYGVPNNPVTASNSSTRVWRRIYTCSALQSGCELVAVAKSRE